MAVQGKGVKGKKTAGNNQAFPALRTIPRNMKIVLNEHSE